MDFEEKYLDVLQNMEFAIVQVFRQDRALLDRDVNDAIEGLVRHYNAEERKLNPPRLNLFERAQAVFDSVKLACEIRLGRQPLETGGKTLPAKDVVSTGEIIACLKRIQTSIRRWTKEGGRQGYLGFIAEYIK